MIPQHLHLFRFIASVSVNVASCCHAATYLHIQQKGTVLAFILSWDSEHLVNPSPKVPACDRP